MYSTIQKSERYNITLRINPTQPHPPRPHPEPLPPGPQPVPTPEPSPPWPPSEPNPLSSAGYASLLEDMINFILLRIQLHRRSLA